MTRFELLAPALILCALIATSIMASVIHKRLPAHWRDEETNTTIQLTAGLFTVLTALVLGLMLNSAKNTFESVDRNVHVYGTEIVLLDRTLRRFGPEAMDARNRLLAFARLAMRERPNDHQGILADRRLEGPLDTVGDALNSIKPLDEQHVDLLHDAQQQFQKLVETHWTLIGQAEGTIPPPLIVLVGAWLIAIFANLGYRAPLNVLVVATLVMSAILVSAAIYLILDMDVPYTGAIHVSLQPLERAIALLQR
jgi:hypothetical protein